MYSFLYLNFEKISLSGTKVTFVPLRCVDSAGFSSNVIFPAENSATAVKLSRKDWTLK